MPRHAIAILALLLVLAGCVPPGEGPAEYPVEARPATAPPADPAAPEDSDLAGRAAKAPFDESRLPSSIDVASGVRDERASAAPAGLDGALDLGRLEDDLRYVEAFASARTASPSRVGFDVLEVEPPPGRIALGRDVDARGHATLRFGTSEHPTDVVKVEVAASADAARESLRADLAGYQETLAPFAAGDLGFVLIARDVPVRILFVRANVYVQAWSLAGESVELAALALDRRVQDAPAGVPGTGAAPLALRLAAEAHRGEPAELAIDGALSEIAGMTFSASDDAWVSTAQGRIWLLAPTAGPREVEAIVHDRWLRRSTLRLVVEVRE